MNNSTSQNKNLTTSTAAKADTLEAIVSSRQMADYDRRELEQLEALAQRPGWVMTDRQRARLAELRQEAAVCVERADARTLRSMAAANKAAAVKLVAQALQAIQNAIGARSMMDERQLATAAGDIVEDARFAHLTTADLRVFVKMARCGDFGGTYERINQPLVYKWLTEYCKRRQDAADEAGYREHQRRDRHSLTDAQIANAYANYARMVLHRSQEDPTTLAEEGARQRQMLQTALNGDLSPENPTDDKTPTGNEKPSETGGKTANTGL